MKKSNIKLENIIIENNIEYTVKYDYKYKP